MGDSSDHTVWNHSVGAEEDTDHQDFNQCQTIRKLPAKTLADMEEDNKKAIDPQDFFGNRSGPEYLGFSKWYLNFTFTPGRPY